MDGGKSENQVFILVICNVAGDFRKAFSKIWKACEKVKSLDVFVIGEFFSNRFPMTSKLIEAVISEGNKLPCPINVLMSSKEVESLGEHKEQLGDNIHISTGNLTSSFLPGSSYQVFFALLFKVKKV